MESQKQLEKKFESYRIWADSQRGQEFICDLYQQAGAINPLPHFRLLFVIAPKVPGSEEARLDQFDELVERQPVPFKKQVWVTSTAQLRIMEPEKLLHAPIWFRDDGADAEFSMFPYRFLPK